MLRQLAVALIRCKHIIQQHFTTRLGLRSKKRNIGCRGVEDSWRLPSLPFWFCFIIRWKCERSRGNGFVAPSLWNNGLGRVYRFLRPKTAVEEPRQPLMGHTFMLVNGLVVLPYQLAAFFLVAHISPHFPRNNKRNNALDGKAFHFAGFIAARFLCFSVG